jgi:tetratricopeptide (TPR) repeat protein
MREVATVEAWGRRKELVTDSLAAAGAVTGLVFLVLGEIEPAVVSFGFAAVSGLIRAWFALKLAAAKRRREGVHLDRQLHVEIGPVGEIDPTEIGVDPAAREETHLDVDVPEYVTRIGVDDELNRALRDALEGSGREIVVIYGLPKVGKSRTLFEGLCRLSDEGVDLRLIAPTSGDAVRELLERFEISPGDRNGPRHVLWLDDIENFVADDVGPKELAAWLHKGAIVAATYGGKGAKRNFGDKSDGVAALADRIMLQARQIGLQPTTPAEVAQLPKSLAKVNRQAIEEYGLAAALVAAPQLDLRLKSQHGASEPASAAGAAIVYTAINWARCGRTDAIPKELLRELWPTHLQGMTLPNTDKVFMDGLNWALEAVTGRVALLKGVNSFRAYDYIRSAAANDPHAPRISEATWRQALDTNDPSQAFGVGMAASAAKRTRDAESALALAASHKESEIAGAASFNLALLLEEKGEEARSKEALRQAQKLGSSAALTYSSREAAERKASEEVSGPPLHVREAIERQLREEFEDGTMKWKEELYQDKVEEGDGAAADDLGLAMLHDGKLREAEEMFRRAIQLGYMHSTVSLGLVLEDLGDLEGAEAAFREAAEHDFPDGAFNLGVLLKDRGDVAGSEEALRKAAALGVPAAASNLAILLEQRGDLAGAESAYRRAVELGFPQATAALGGLQARMGRMDEAEATFRRAAERGEISGAVSLARLLIERGDIAAAREALRPYAEANETDESLLVATVLEEMGDLEGAEVAYREAMERDIGIAAFSLGRMLEREGRIKDAEEAFERAAELEVVERAAMEVADLEDDDEDGEPGGGGALARV